MDIIEYKRKIPILDSTDVLVIGGSQSGVVAAVAAKRANSDIKVMIIEQFGYLGGQSVGTMVVHYEFREYVNNAGQRIVKGIGHEIIKRVVEKGNSDPLFKEYLKGKAPPFTDLPDNRAFGDVPLDLEDLKLTLQEMCEEEGIIIKYFTKLVDIIADKSSNGFIKPNAAIVAYQNGLEVIKAKIIIDCSANNDVAYFLGKNYFADPEKFISIPKHQVMNMQTYAWLGGVDLKRFIDAVFEHPEYWQMIYPNNKEQMLLFMKQGKVIQMRGGAYYIDLADEKFEGILEEYEKLGTIPIIYYWLKTIKTHKITISNNDNDLDEEKSKKTIVCEKYIGDFAIEGPSFLKPQTDPENVNQAMLNQLKAVHLLRKIHSVLPGWENCYILRTAQRMGFRQTRVLKGIYKLTREDVKDHRRFEDVIGRNTGHDVGRGNPYEEYGYDIPYRILVPAEIDGLLIAARSVSCDIEDKALTALNAHRGICATIVCGQAAGVAAALCLKHNVEPRNLDVKILQDILKKQDVILDPPPEGPKGFYRQDKI
ncbi:MAG: FAD-dependent oxidoreductase [Promethearchaeota archaeon]